MHYYLDFEKPVTELENKIEELRRLADGKDMNITTEIKKLENYIAIELNVKNIEYSTEESKFIKLFAKPNAPVLGKRLGKEFGKFRKLIQNLTESDLSDLEKKGDIYKATYAGWYCTPDEAFIMDKEVQDQDIQEGDAPTCPQCGRTTTWVSEECYFFKLSKYQDKLLQFYKDNPHLKKF